MCIRDRLEGAFVCEYAIFKDIYKLNMRNLKRLCTSMFLALITVDSLDNSTPDSLLLDKIMRILGETLKSNLRRGDTVSRYSPSQYAVLLPTVNYQSGQIVLERIKKAFYSNCTTSQFMINYKLKPISMEEMCIRDSAYIGALRLRRNAADGVAIQQTRLRIAAHALF